MRERSTRRRRDFFSWRRSGFVAVVVGFHAHVEQQVMNHRFQFFHFGHEAVDADAPPRVAHVRGQP